MTSFCLRQVKMFKWCWYWAHIFIHIWIALGENRTIKLGTLKSWYHHFSEWFNRCNCSYCVARICFWYHLEASDVPITWCTLLLEKCKHSMQLNMADSLISSIICIFSCLHTVTDNTSGQKPTLPPRHVQHWPQSGSSRSITSLRSWRWWRGTHPSPGTGPGIPGGWRCHCNPWCHVRWFVGQSRNRLKVSWK